MTSPSLIVGIANLNVFLRYNALNFTEKRIANTYVLNNNGQIDEHTRLMFFDMMELG